MRTVHELKYILTYFLYSSSSVPFVLAWMHARVFVPRFKDSMLLLLPLVQNMMIGTFKLPEKCDKELPFVDFENYLHESFGAGTPIV